MKRSIHYFNLIAQRPTSKSTSSLGDGVGGFSPTRKMGILSRSHSLVRKPEISNTNMQLHSDDATEEKHKLCTYAAVTATLGYIWILEPNIPKTVAQKSSPNCWYESVREATDSLVLENGVGCGTTVLHLRTTSCDDATQYGDL